MNMLPLIYAFVSVAVVSLISLFGATALLLKESVFLRRLIFVLVSLSVGVLFGDVFIHLIPGLIESGKDSVFVSAYILLGILIFFVLEKFFRWHHAHSEHEGDEEDKVPESFLGSMVLLGDGIHNLIDGMIIGASYMVSVEIGIATTLAVIFHEIPQEIGDFAVLLHAGFSRAKALLFNFLSASLAFAGLLIVIGVRDLSQDALTAITAITAGGFIYIAGSDLVPELHKTKEASKSLIQLVSILVGFAVMYLLLLLE